MLTQNEMDMLDTFIRGYLQLAQEQTKRTDRALGAQAFGFLKNPHMKLQAIKGGPNKKPQQLRLADVLNLCEALGVSWQDAIRSAIAAVKSTKR